MRLSRSIFPAFAGLALLSVASSASAQALYESDFESTGDPSGVDYTLGNLDGQDGWAVEEGGTAEVSNDPSPGAANGENFVAQGLNSKITRDVTGSLTDRLLIRAYCNLPGSETLEPPTSARPIAAAIAFRRIDDNSMQIAAYDGALADFVEPAGSLPSNTWHKVIINLRYTDKNFDVAVNNQPHLQDVNFFDDSIASLSGFEAHSRNGSNLDSLGFFFSDGDYDDDGYSDDEEMEIPGADPFDPDLPGEATPTPTLTLTPTLTPTLTATLTATLTPTATVTLTPTLSITPTPTATVTPTETATVTPSISPTATETPIPTQTETPVPTETETPVPTATDTPVPTATETPIPTETETPVPTETETPVPTETETPVPTETETPVPTETETPVPTATETPVPTETETPVPTETETPVPTATESPSVTPSATAVPQLTPEEIARILAGQDPRRDGADVNGDGVVDAADTVQ